ncbi:hypothetical protein [Leptolyngbya sp. 7M]|uniref:hypothetical protein n=1 Tax=Leptolyngbya sp. 7M TaxID=2812896 RepID=UPI001B8D41B4|nr:hypothetical protein [Leptolyngbya sp. 7M]QYO67648.1 hypothetical protein JVX88_13155 [Leptolyngbya sp. 7M]
MFEARTIALKLVSIFLIAFVCLNGIGALCVAYCQAFESEQQATAPHCPRGEAMEIHREASTEDLSSSFAAHSERLDCCPLTVTFVSAPSVSKFEIQPISFVLASAPSPTQSPEISRRSLYFGRVLYRGPPLDRRVERIKLRVLLI